MQKIIRGICWSFPDNFPTDMITAKERLSLPFPEMAKYVFETFDPEIAKHIKRGDILAGGQLFGCSSSRVAAVKVLAYIGIGAVVAESISRLFYRNCISLGVPAMECKGISKMIATGDELEVDIVSGLVTNLATKKTIHADPVPKFALEIMEQGGIVPFMKARGLLDLRE